VRDEPRSIHYDHADFVVNGALAAPKASGRS
jgi:hypothetical protein